MDVRYKRLVFVRNDVSFLSDLDDHITQKTHDQTFQSPRPLCNVARRIKVAWNLPEGYRNGDLRVFFRQTDET